MRAVLATVAAAVAVGAIALAIVLTNGSRAGSTSVPSERAAATTTYIPQIQYRGTGAPPVSTNPAAPHAELAAYPRGGDFYGATP